MTRDFPASLFQLFVGKCLISVEDYPNVDEGLILTFEDKTKLKVAFSGCEGQIEIEDYSLKGE